MPAQTALLHSDMSNDIKDIAKSNAGILEQLQNALKTMDDEIYIQPPQEGFSAIGGHVRHIVEFYQELLKTTQNNFEQPLSYDNRKRNLLIETSREVALNEISKLKTLCCELDYQEQRTIELSMMIDCASGHMMTMTTTPLREMFHVLDHAIHHMALIKMTAQQIGLTLDKNFGMANATLVHNNTVGNA